MLSWADYAILVICAASAVFGLWRGFVKEAISLVTWLAAIFLAWRLAWVLEPTLGEWIAAPEAKLWIARLIILVLVLIIGGLIGWAIRAVIHATGLGGMDRLLGGMFGFARGALIVGLLVIGLEVSGLGQDPWWRDSRLRPLAVRVADAIRYYGSLGAEYLRDQEILRDQLGV